MGKESKATLEGTIVWVLYNLKETKYPIVSCVCATREGAVECMLHWKASDDEHEIEHDYRIEKHFLQEEHLLKKGQIDQIS